MQIAPHVTTPRGLQQACLNQQAVCLCRSPFTTPAPKLHLRYEQVCSREMVLIVTYWWELEGNEISCNWMLGPSNLSIEI